MTKAIPVKRPPQSAFLVHLGNEVDKKEGDQIDDCVDRRTLETTLPTLSPLFTMDNNHKQKLQLKLDSARLKVETVSKLVDTAMFRVRDRVTHWIERRLKHDAKLERTTKLKENLLRLEKVKVEVINFRTEKRRALKWLVRRQKIKRDGDEPLSQIRNSSNFGTIDNDDINEVVIGESDKIQPNDLRQQSGQDEMQQQSEEAMTIEEIKLAARAKIAEENSMAKEVRRRKMVTPAKDREETKLDIEKDEESELEKIDYGQNHPDDLIVGVQISIMCKMLDCTIEELFDSTFSDSLEPAIEMTENSSPDAKTVQCTLIDLVQAIEEYDSKLLDIELKQSAILAEEAAFKREHGFKIDVEGK